jgi:hypothetical protein
MKRIPLKGGDEHDAFSRRARKVLCALSRPGVCKSAKKKYNKRFRKEVKLDVRNSV